VAASSGSPRALTEQVHLLFGRLPRFDSSTARKSLPANGIYVFFEKGETVRIDGSTHDRIVRVGTHNSDGRFPDRVRQHFTGNKSASVFRLHLGGALLRRKDPSDPRLSVWLQHNGPLFPEIEPLVAAALRERFTFSYVRVDDASERLRIEAGLIALLAQHPLAPPSPTWLGRWAFAPAILRSGLWNTQKVDSVPLDEEGFRRLRSLAAESPSAAAPGYRQSPSSTLVVAEQRHRLETPTATRVRRKRMPAAIDWTVVSKDHVLAACKRYDRGERPSREAQNTWLHLNGKKYPAKFIRLLAYHEATHKMLNPSTDFAGGAETAKFLQGLGFDVEYGGAGQSASSSSTLAADKRPPQVTSSRPPSPARSRVASTPAGKKTRIVSVCVHGRAGGRPRDPARRLKLLEDAVRGIEERDWKGIDVVLFPGGFFNFDTHLGHLSFSQRVALLSKSTFSGACAEQAEMLARRSPGAYIVAGVDTVPLQRAAWYGKDGADQLAVAWRDGTVKGIGRKVFPAPGEEDSLVCYGDDFSAERRIIELSSGRRAVLSACYDLFGCSETSDQPSARSRLIKYIAQGDEISAVREPGYSDRRGGCIDDFHELLVSKQVTVGLACIHQFLRPGLDLFWQRHGIATASAVLRGFAAAAAHFDQRLPDAFASTLASGGVPKRHVDEGQHRQAHRMAPKDDFYIGDAALVRLFEWP
jgi:hypothetical protein